MSQKIQVYEKRLVELDLLYDDFLKELTEKHEILKSKGVQVVSIEYDYDYSGYAVMYGSRLETDEEFNTRISKEKETIENKKNKLMSDLKNFSKKYPEEYEQLMKEI